MLILLAVVKNWLVSFSWFWIWEKQWFFFFPFLFLCVRSTATTVTYRIPRQQLRTQRHRTRAESYHLLSNSQTLGTRTYHPKKWGITLNLLRSQGFLKRITWHAEYKLLIKSQEKTFSQLIGWHASQESTIHEHTCFDIKLMLCNTINLIKKINIKNIVEIWSSFLNIW